jgi:WD40 repeat protein
VYAVAFSPDGRTIASINEKKIVVLWDLTDRAHPRRVGPPLINYDSLVDSVYAEYPVYSVVFSPDGRALAATGDKTVILWDLTDRAHPIRLGPPLTGHTAIVGAVAFSADGNTLGAASEDSTVILWDLTDRARPRRLGPPLTGHTAMVGTVAFSPDGNTLASGSSDRTVMLWDLTDRTQPRRLGSPLTDHSASVNAVAFSPDGHTVASASKDKTIILWDLIPLEQLRRDVIKEACTRAGGSLVKATWSFYAPGVNYQDACAEW